GSCACAGDEWPDPADRRRVEDPRLRQARTAGGGLLGRLGRRGGGWLGARPVVPLRPGHPGSRDAGARRQGGPARVAVAQTLTGGPRPVGPVGHGHEGRLPGARRGGLPRQALLARRAPGEGPRPTSGGRSHQRHDDPGGSVRAGSAPSRGRHGGWAGAALGAGVPPAPGAAAKRGSDGVEGAAAVLRLGISLRPRLERRGRVRAATARQARRGRDRHRTWGRVPGRCLSGLGGRGPGTGSMPERARWPWRRYWVDVAWAAFGVANLVAMLLLPEWETVPFHFIWVSLTLLYGFRVWRVRPTVLTLAVVMV